MTQFTQKRPIGRIAGALLALTLTACGSGSSNGPPPPPPPPPPPQVTIQTGYLIDATVSGIDYQSGSTTGVTDASGTFRYELRDGNAQDVTFTLGSIPIGTALGRPIVTPLDFVDNSDTQSLAVLNIARFLQAVDADGDPDNGIVVSAAVRDALAGQAFSPVDFSDADFANQPAVTNILSFLNSIDSQTYMLPTAQSAQRHLQDSLACLASGIYAGRFDGGDSGTFAVLVQHQRVDPLLFGDLSPRVGVASALIYSEPQDRLIGVLPQQALAFDSGQSFVVGIAANGAEFSGALDGFEQISNGRWRNEVEGGSGAFAGSRLEGDVSAVYRLSGGFGDNTPADVFDDTPDNRGGIAIDVFADGTVVGTMISARGEQFLLSGTVDGDTINASSDSGMTDVSITFDATGQHPLSAVVGLFGVPGFWGSWQSGAVSGGLVGTSCTPR